MKNSDYVLRFEVSHRATLKRTILTPILHSSFFILHLRIASARLFTFHFSLFTFHFSLFTKEKVPNCVSAIFHFSLFTLHFSLFTKKKPPVIRHITSGYRGHFYLVLETNVPIIISIHDDSPLSGHIAIEQ